MVVEPRRTGMSMSSSGSHATPRWRKPDSNSQSHPRERVSFDDKPTQIPKAMSWADERSAATMIQEIEFAPDSPLEGDGFELPVPREMTTIFEPSCFWFL